MKRFVAGFLWFFALWYLGAVVASILNVPDVVGPIVGLAAGVLVAVDPRHVIWTSPRPKMETVEA
jgi:putative effector of murein hydrolase LrgA (UPF0299 family)